jgi:HKD family nuclease
MPMINLIFNNKNSNHKDSLLECFDKSSTISIAVAFLKTSGLEILFSSIEKAVKRDAVIKIFCGLDFGLTEPEALKKILKLFESYPESSLFVVEKFNSTFHPKIYSFLAGPHSSIFIGSANLTSGGLESNEEASFLVSCKPTDEVFKNVENYFTGLIGKESCKKVTLLFIKQYEVYYNAQKKARSQIKAKPDVWSSVHHSFNYENLLKFYKEFISDNNINKMYKGYGNDVGMVTIERRLEFETILPLTRIRQRY